MNLFSQYRGLRRELYVLFWGRVVTNMGALIWPMMTLILTNKLGYTPGEASNLILLVGVALLPCTLIGGKLADRVDKKKLIVLCDLVTVMGYITCAFLPFDRHMVIILAIAGIFAQLEWPSFDALVANLSSPEERERAYSLNYLGGNLGLVLAPTMGGLLFENHLDLAFLISGIATFSSTVLIFFFIKDTSRSVGNQASGIYENEQKGSTREIFTALPVMRIFIVCIAVVSAIYGAAFAFLMPLSMDDFYGTKGALYFGTLTSVNAITVIVGTPILTDLLKKIRDVSKIQIGAFLEIAGCGIFALAGKTLWLCYVGMIVFTLGEVLLSLGEQPYLTRRVPASHRGRISAVRSVGQMLLQGVLLFIVGRWTEALSLRQIWVGVVLLGLCNVGLMYKMRRDDRREFALLYTQEERVLPDEAGKECL